MMIVPPGGSDNEDDENSVSSDSSLTSSDEEWEPPQRPVQQDDTPSVEEEETDPLVLAFKNAYKDGVFDDTPPAIPLRVYITDLSFHPSDSLVAISSLTGDVFLYRYSAEECRLQHTFELHKESCIGVEFSECGNWFATAGSDKHIVISDTNTDKVLQFYDNAHAEAISSIHIINEKLFCTGDERGVVKIWDVRSKKATHSFNAGDEEVTSMLTKDKYLVCSSSDSIVAYDWIAGTIYAKSETEDVELTSMCLMKNDKKLVVGDVKGNMWVYNWGQFGYHCDQLKGPFKSRINALLPVTDNIMLMANECEKGFKAHVSARSVYPHKHLGVVGSHDVSSDRLDISHDGELVGSVGNDDKLCFWNVRFMEDVPIETSRSHPSQRSNYLPSSRTQNPGAFFSDMA